jgi:hypothetical protein
MSRFKEVAGRYREMLGNFGCFGAVMVNLLETR